MQCRPLPASGRKRGEVNKGSIRLAPERAELKLLYRSPRRRVLVPPRIDQFKAGSKRRGETVCVVTADDQAAAAFRAVRRERTDDRMPARAQGASKPRDIGHLIVRIGEKMKRRAVVPQIIDFAATQLTLALRLPSLALDAMSAFSERSRTLHLRAQARHAGSLSGARDQYDGACG